MLWEAFAFAALGLTAAYAAVRRLPERFPPRILVLSTGPVAVLVGGFIARTVLGSHHVALTLIAAAVVAAALLSLLIRPTAARPASSPHPA